MTLKIPAATALVLALSGLVHAQSGTFDVRAYGANGNGNGDDTAAIQAAVDAAAAAGGGTVIVPAGVYPIQGFNGSDHHGVALKSRTTLQMMPGAVLKAIPTASGNYSVIRIWEQDDVTVRGGTLLGERGAHLGTTGEWGFGVDIRGSTNVTLEDVAANEFWGDGFYVDRTARGPSRNIRINRCRADRNRRQGLSFVGCIGATVTDSEFTNTQGTNPEGGIDLEPDPGVTHNVVENVKIQGCHFAGNNVGVVFAGVSNNVVSGCTITGSRLAAVHLTMGASQNVVTNNTISDNARALLTTHAERNIVSNNMVTRTQGLAFELVNKAVENVIQGNVIDSSGQAQDDRYSAFYVGYDSDRNLIQGNSIRMGKQATRPAWGIIIATWDSDGNVVANNDVRGSGATGAIKNDGTDTILSGNWE